MADHDSSYKQIFSHPRAVADLLRGFVHEDWVGRVDFSTLEKLNASYITDDFRERADDLVWRVKLAAGESEWVYVYLLMEFQSTPDRFMAVRIMSYLALLYLDLIKSGRVGASGAGRLPAVFPIVIYNGEARWRAARGVEDLIEETPGALAAYRPRLKYFLLDEGRVPEGDLEDAHNTAASVIRLERSARPEDIQPVVRHLVDALKSPENLSLRRGLTVWLKRVVLKRVVPHERLPEMDDLEEVDNMLGERIEKWKEEWKREAMEEGLREGRQEGEAALLVRLLARRFGPVPDWVKERVACASVEDIDAWALRILDAETLEAVFETH